MGQDLKSSKMANMPIRKLVLSMSLPAIASMLVQALYNVVDSMFLSRYVSPEAEAAGLTSAALDAVTIAFPLQMLIVAFAIGIGVGTNAFLSRLLGAKQNEEASLVARTGLVMSLIAAVCFVGIGLVTAGPFMSMYTDDPIIGEMGRTYLTIVMCVSVFSFVEITLSKILQATGNMIVPMIAQLAGAITNIIFDPLFIFGIWIFPEMGIAGAAVATVMGQGVGMCVSLFALIFRKQDVSLNMRGFRFKRVYVLGIMRVGLPTTIMNAINSVTTSLMNFIIKGYQYAITVLGIYFKAQSFIFMPVFGLMQGVLPIMSYNYGANRMDRFKQTYRTAIVTALCIMTVGLAIFMFAPGVIMGMFNADSNMMEVGIPALRLMALCFLPAAVGISTSTGFQSLNRGFIALMMSLTRQLVVIIPMGFLLEYLFGLNGAFFAYFMSELVSIPVFVPLFLRRYKREFLELSKA